MRILSEKIKELRLDLGYSIAYVAETLNVRESVIERYENPNARKKISPKLISDLTRLLQCEPSDIVDWNSEDPYKQRDDERKSMVTLYDGHTYQIGNFPQVAQDELRAYIEQLMKKYNIEK